jgi:folylpolyglutamate synthase/dihydropteroate synthase
MYLQEAYGRPLPMVVAAMGDKHIAAILEALAPAASHFICTAVDSHRAASAETIAGLAREVGSPLPVSVSVATPPMAALEAAVEMGSPVVVAGSLYLAGEIRSQLS